jgi:hypothetical protein
VVVILDNGEKMYELELDGKTYTAYKNTALPNHYNIVMHCKLTGNTVVLALHKRILTELATVITK